MQLQRLLLMSCCVVVSLYAPPQGAYVKNSVRWVYGNHKAKRQSAEFAVAINHRAKRSSSLSPKLSNRTKYSKKAVRMALKKQQIELEEMACPSFHTFAC